MGYDKVDDTAELVRKHGDAMARGQLIPISEAASILGVSQQRVMQLLLSRGLQGIRIMGPGFGLQRWFVWRSSVAARKRGMGR